jgi:hypothetical protein
MKFFGRETELERLAGISEHAKSSGYLTMITGRRRVGKTTLVKHFLQRNKVPNCYFFISRKQPKSLLSEFSEILSEIFPEIAGLRFEDFDGFFKFLFQKLTTASFTFVMDEFQNFKYVDPAVFSILQKYWDNYKDKIKGHIIVIGSIQTLMHHIFENRKEPLFKRLTGKIIVKPFAINEMKPLFASHLSGDPRASLEAYLLFNGIPFYYYLMEKEHLFDSDLLQVIHRLVLRHDGLLFNEGKELTVEEFGKNYGRYFSILEAIASGHTQWNNIATQSGISPNSLGKYLNELLNFYGLIEKVGSVFSRDTAKTSRYYLRDNFLTFWFRYVNKNFSILEQYASERFLPKIKRDLPNFFGPQFEKFVASWLQMQSIASEQNLVFDQVGKYWDKGQNEIDVVAYSDDHELCLVGECKWNSKRVSSTVVAKLSQHVEVIKRKQNFKKFQKALFVGDIASPQLRESLKKQDVKIFDVSDYWRT